MIPHEIGQKLAAAMLPVWLSAAANKIERSPEDHIAVMIEVAIDAVDVREIVAAAQKSGEYCCQEGCGGGACESCPCCVAGWCVSGLDGVPLPGSPENPADDPDHAAELFRGWLETAAEKNPVAKALAQAVDQWFKPKDTREELTVDSAPAVDLFRLFPEIQPGAYGRELGALIEALFHLVVVKRGAPADKLDLSTLRFEIRRDPISDRLRVLRASARINPPGAD